VVPWADETDSPLQRDAAGSGEPPGKGTQMNDIVAVALSIGFFAVAAAFVHFCDKVR
jgi:hypothetical protein